MFKRAKSEQFTVKSTSRSVWTDKGVMHKMTPELLNIADLNMCTVKNEMQLRSMAQNVNHDIAKVTHHHTHNVNHDMDSGVQHINIQYEP